MFAKGDAVWIKSGPPTDPDREHLFCVVTNPCPQGKQLLVNMTSVVPGRLHDQACLLVVGDHPAINHDSFIDYSFALLIDRAEFALLQPKVRAAPAWYAPILQRIADGITTSKRISMKNRVHYQTHKGL